MAGVGERGDHLGSGMSQGRFEAHNRKTAAQASGDPGFPRRQLNNLAEAGGDTIGELLALLRGSSEKPDDMGMIGWLMSGQYDHTPNREHIFPGGRFSPEARAQRGE